MIDEVFNACLKSQARGENSFYSRLADEFGYKSPEALRSAFRREKKRRGMHNQKESERTTYEQGDDYINIVCSSKRIKTKEDVIKEFEIDMTKWKIEKFIVRTDEAWRKDRKVQWKVTNGKVAHGDVDDSGKILLVPLTRVEVRFVPLEIDDIGAIEIERFFETYHPKSISKKIIPKQYSLNGKALEICLADLHNARMLSASNASGAKKNLEETILDIKSRAEGKKFEIIYFVPLGDLSDADNMKSTTTNGTQQYLTMTIYQMLESTASMMIWAVDQLKEIAPIQYIFIPGNHDRILSFAVAKIVEANYKDDKNVTVDVGHAPHKWTIFGESLIAWTHGDMTKKNLLEWLPARAREEWGKTKYAEVHSGDKHTQTVIESVGHIVRSLPSSTELSLWEDERGYTSVRSTISFVWDIEKGLQEQWYSNNS